MAAEGKKFEVKSKQLIQGVGAKQLITGSTKYFPFGL